METIEKMTKTATLYERLGGEVKVRKIVNDTLDKNFRNPVIGPYFHKLDMDNLKRLVFEFFFHGHRWASSIYRKGYGQRPFQS